MSDLPPSGAPAGEFYTAVTVEETVEFWDLDVLLFTVPASLATNQEQRDALARLWDHAIEVGRVQGREKLKQDLRNDLNAKP